MVGNNAAPVLICSDYAVITDMVQQCKAQESANEQAAENVVEILAYDNRRNDDCDNADWTAVNDAAAWDRAFLYVTLFYLTAPIRVKPHLSF